MKNVGPNEVQLSDMTNQFYQMNIKIHGRKGALSLRLRFNLFFFNGTPIEKE